MSQLSEIIRAHRETIESAFVKRLSRTSCPRLGTSGSRGVAEVLDVLLACCENTDRAPALDWAKSLAKQAEGIHLNYCRLLIGLNCLQGVLRFWAIRAIHEKKPLLNALTQLDDVLDLLRTSAADAWPSGRGDAGARKALERSLGESEARKRAILESSLDPIITIDHDGVITEFNRAAEHVFGRPRKEVLGTQPSEILFPPAKTEGQQNRIDRYLDAGEGSLLGKRTEVVAVRADGTPFSAEMTMAITRQNGLPVMTFFVRDISLRKQSEEDQLRYARELERSNRELQQFAYVASHDLQEPLRKICTFGDRLEMHCGEALDEMGHDCLNRMQSAARRMQSLIDGLLTLSRISTQPHDFVRVDLGKIAQDVVSDLEVRIEQAEARVELGKLPTIEADPLQIRQLLQNLISNALKFCRENEAPTVKVHGRFVRGRTQRDMGESPAEERLRILVEDNGIGFDEKYLDRIFDVFQRLHPRDVHEGTGVGLAICRRIVERHGGTITASSRPGEGATFEITLPVAQRGRTDRP